MDKEMININANLLKEPTFGTFTRGDEEVQVVNFALSKGYEKVESISTVQPMAINLKWLRNFQKVISFMYMATSINELKMERHIRILWLCLWTKLKRKKKVRRNK